MPVKAQESHVRGVLARKGASLPPPVEKVKQTRDGPAGAHCTASPAAGIELTPVLGAFTGYGATSSLSAGVDMTRLG